jgi:hypothetical protein
VCRTVKQNLIEIGEEIWTVREEIWTVHEEMWTVRVEIWTVRDEIWTVRVEIWTVRVEIWTVREEIWTVRVEIHLPLSVKYERLNQCSQISPLLENFLCRTTVLNLIKLLPMVQSLVLGKEWA